MPKTPQNIAISFSGDSLTHFGGLYLLQQFFQAIKLRRALAQAIRFRQRNTKYTASDSILAIVYPIILGLGRIERASFLKQNNVFQHIAGFPTYPDPTTIRRFLNRFGLRGLKAFINLHDHLRYDFLQEPSSLNTVIFDVDTTVLTVYGHQVGAKVGYNPKKRGRPSFHPLLCFEGNTEDCLRGEFYPGDTHPAKVTIPLLEHCFQKLPTSCRQVRFRADNAFYDRNIVEYLLEKRAFFAIVARITKPVQNKIRGLKYQEISPRLAVSEFEYQPFRWKSPQRFIVIRRPIPEERSWQLTLFKMQGYTYQVIVTNLSLQPLNLWRFYNHRASGELIIKELLYAYTLGKIPTGDWASNQAYFHLTLFAFNLFNWFKRLCLPPKWQRFHLQTLRDRLLLVPAELVRPQRKPTLKLPTSFPYKKVYMETLKNIKRLRWK